jgi:membrane peptidoglycan carboxypeptidase
VSAESLWKARAHAPEVFGAFAEHWGFRRRGCRLRQARRLRSPEFRVRILRTIIILFALAATAWLCIPKPPLVDDISFSQVVRDRNGKLLRITLSADQKFRIRTPLRDVSPELVRATLQYEDKYYSEHPGVNPFALGRCAVDFIRSGRVVAGGSTITMQVARLRFHLQTRNLPGKLVQILRAIQLERHYTKDQIWRPTAATSKERAPPPRFILTNRRPA